jgi:hypothetical protein
LHGAAQTAQIGQTEGQAVSSGVACRLLRARVQPGPGFIPDRHCHFLR